MWNNQEFLNQYFFGFVLDFIFLISICENGFYNEPLMNTEIESQQELSFEQELNS